MMDETMMRHAKDSGLKASATNTGKGAGREAGVTNPENERALESWKDIAAHLNRTVRTVKRWEREEGLPIHRLMHLSRASVYAYASELDAWKQKRNPASEAGGILFRWPIRIPAFAMTLLLALVTAGGGLIHPPTTAAQGQDVVVRRVWSGPEVDPMGFPSADGRLLTFVDWSTGDLAIRDLTTGQNRRLTNKGTWSQSDEYAEHSVLSPDAKTVAYAWFAGRSKGYELRLVGIDGTGARTLYRSDAVFYVQPAAWSLDGKYVLAALGRRDNTNQIVLVSVADGSARVLKTLDWRYPQKLSLSPDGRFVAYNFPPQEELPQRDIFVLATDGSREVRAVEHPAHDFLVGWSPDGGQLFFASDRTGAVSLFSQQILDGRPVGQATLVRQDLGRVYPIGLARNGVFFYATGGTRDVFSAAFDAVAGTLMSEPQNAAQKYEGQNFSADWSPDGEFLAYFSQRRPPQTAGASTVLVIRSEKNGQERELAPQLRLPGNPRQGMPRWSPDGRSILVTGRNEKGRNGIFQIEMADGSVKPLVFAQNEERRLSRAEWVRDGKAIVFRREVSRDGISEIVRRELATGKETVFHRARHIHSWALSADSRYAALGTDDPATPVPDGGIDVLLGRCLLIVSLTGGDAKEILRLPETEEFKALAWTPDSRHVLFSRHEGLPEDNPAYARKVWRIAITGGEAQLVQLPLTGGQLSGLRFHPDGKRIAYTVANPVAEIWTMENFLPSLKAQK